MVYLPGHLPGVATPVWTCAANGLVGLQSSKKPFWVFRKRCRLFLKLFTESTSRACWSRLFHLLMSLSAKKLRLTSKVLLCFTSFNVCPLRCFVDDNSNIDSRRIADKPLAILNTSMISALFRLSSKLQSPSCFNLSPYDNFENPGIILVNRCCTLSINDKLWYFGHVMRHNCLEKNIIQGSLSGTRTREIPKITWWNITDRMKMHLGRLAINKTKLRRTVHSADNCHSEEGWKKTKHNIARIFIHLTKLIFLHTLEYNSPPKTEMTETIWSLEDSWNNLQHCCGYHTLLVTLQHTMKDYTSTCLA